MMMMVVTMMIMIMTPPPKQTFTPDYTTLQPPNRGEGVPTMVGEGVWAGRTGIKCMSICASFSLRCTALGTCERTPTKILSKLDEVCARDYFYH